MYKITKVERGLSRPRRGPLGCILWWKFPVYYTYCQNGKFYIEILRCKNWTRVVLGLELWLCGIDIEKGSIIT
ncbi:MAG: hypothetical protein ACK4M3_07160 [Pyrobaculum sp.]